jgi:hypothetical protein
LKEYLIRGHGGSEIYVMKMLVFWGVAPCSLVEKEQCFGGSYCFHLQGDRPQ